MKKFFQKLFIYALLLLLPVLAVNQLYIYTIGLPEPEINNVPDNIQICSFGSSHALYGFNYADIQNEYTCFNFGLASQTLRYDCKLLEHYRDKIQKGAAVFIVVSYFSFFGKPEIDTDGFAQRNRRYYRFLPRKAIDAYDINTDIMMNYLPSLNTDKLQDFIGSLLVLLRLKKPAIQDSFDVWSSDTSPKAASEDAVHAYTRHIVSGRLDKSGKRIYKQEAFDAFYRMIEICREIEAVPIMITVPYLKEYTDTVKQKDPEFLKDFYGVTGRLQKETGIKYYDYSIDERFSHSYNLFMNSDHMNKEGARIFTDDLMREILGLQVN